MLRFQRPTNLSHIALALGSSPNNFCEMMYPWCWFGSESPAIGDSWTITHRDPWAVSNSITRALIISQSNPLFRLIWYFFLHTVLCILKNKTSWIRSPLMTKWCLKKERSNERKTSHRSQNTNGSMPHCDGESGRLPWSCPPGRCWQQLDRSCPPRVLWKSPLLILATTQPHRNKKKLL